MRLGGALALVLVAGIGGAVIGRAIVSPAAPQAQVLPPHARPVADAGDGCKAERAELGSAKAQLAICTAYAQAPPREAPTEASAETPTRAFTEWEAAEVARVRRSLEARATGREIVVVHHTDGTLEDHLAEEWPIDGDGIIVGRRLPGGKMGWYAGPDAGPRTNPAAFVVPEPGSPLAPIIERAPDGKLYVNGELGAPGLQAIFPGTKRR